MEYIHTWQTLILNCCILHFPPFYAFFHGSSQISKEECYIFPDLMFLNFILSQNFHFIFLVRTAEFVQVYLRVIVFFSDLLFVSGTTKLATSHCSLHKLKVVVVKTVLEQMSVALKLRDIKFQVINHSQ